MSAPLILAAACCFPSGPNIELADTAVRSSLSLVQRHPVYLDRCGNPVKLNRFPIDVPQDASRWCVLARAALADLIDRLQRHATLLSNEARPRLLWLVLPDPDWRPGIPPDLVDRLTKTVQVCTPWPWQQIILVQGGHAAGILALDQARQALATNPDALAAVLAVESGFAEESLMWLEYQNLFHGTYHPFQGGARANPYGRIPGEGAAAIALTGRLERGSAPAWATLLGVGTAAEPVTYYTSEPCVGKGLTEAARLALASYRQAANGRIAHLIADLNGEPYRADQLGFVVLRLGHALSDDWQRSLPALASGDLNTASALTHVCLSAYAFGNRLQASPHLILASSDDPLRGAALLGGEAYAPSSTEVSSWQPPSTSMV